MRQTESALRMLTTAYKAVLTNCYVTENLAGGVKHFCKSVALSALLASALISYPTLSLAEDRFYDDGQENLNIIPEDNIDNVTINVSENGTKSGIWITGDININNKLTINNIIQNEINGKGISAYQGHVTISAKEIEINSYDDGIFTTGPTNDGPDDPNTDINIKNFDKLDITSSHGFGIINNGNSYGSPSTFFNPNNATEKGDIYVTGNANSIINIQGGYHSNDPLEAKAAVKNGVKKLIGDNSTDYKTVIKGGTINLTGVGYGTWSETGNVEVYGTNNRIQAILDDRFTDQYNLNAYKYFGIGIYNQKDSSTTIIEAKNQNYIHGDKEGIKSSGGKVSVSGTNNIIDVSYDESMVKDSLKEDVKDIERYAIHSNGKNANTTLTASNTNTITSIGQGIYTEAGSVTLYAENENNLTANNIKGTRVQDGFGNNYAIHALKDSSISVYASSSNNIYGSVFAEGANANIFIGNKDNTASKSNNIYSYSLIKDAGDLTNQNVVSALYAEEGSSITLSGTSNILRTYAVSSSDDLERVIWAYQGNEDETATSINIQGYTDISTDNYQLSTNSKDIAIASGTATNLEDLGADAIRNYDGVRSEVVIEYADSGTAKSTITGDILSAYAGSVDIGAADGDSSSGISITGNLLAGNNGILNVDLGNGGTLTADTGVDNNKATGEEGSYFNPAFSSSILTSGTVDLTMGNASKWYVTGQSWISNITTDSYSGYSDSMPEINLTTYYNSDDENVTTPADGGQALTIGSITGDAVFTMNLDGNDVSNGNMLYMKQADGNYYINLTDAVAESEINNGHDGLRFATVGKGSNVTFYVGSKDSGAFNVEYEVGTDRYAQNLENKMYNGTELNNSKPGNDTVDAIFGEGTNNRAAKIALLSTESADEANPDDGYSQTVDEETTNFKIIAVKNREISDGGKTIINMSRANYANAVYMDTLNKRQGEARFVGDTDHGVWVRLRHDNIGKEDSFRSHNTMVEVGIDQRDVHDYGEFHTGVALDYMNGSLDYHTVDGDGDIERYGVWFYTTYLGNDGQYADLVLKYGHLKNDFGFNTKSQGEHVTGAYTNETASLSAEYGWKFSNSHNYYIEPQAQLQYTYVTGADYTTSQGTKVDLDSIHSLIGRVGIRAGKDFLDWEHPVSLYARADALHEFLGDQDIYAYDDTGIMDITYENDDTWYTVGLGLSVKSSENTYFFIEGETALGADNEDTYTFSGGFRHSF